MDRWSSSAFIKLRRRLLGIPAVETTLAKRGFRPGRPEAQSHLENIGRVFVAGYHAGLEAGQPDDLPVLLGSVESEFRGFAFEGSAMALMLRDHLTPWRRDRFRRLLAGPGEPHTYMVLIGAGWAYARLPWLRIRITAALAAHDPLMRWMVVDGFGFHEGYFAWPRVGVRHQIPHGIQGYARHAFDQGLGRSLWFVSCADAKRIVNSISQFHESRRADLWSGIGLACTYAGGYTETDLAELGTAAGRYRAELAQGAAFAAKARVRAGNLVPHTEHASHIFCGVSAREAAGITDIALRALPQNQSEPAYEIWRRRVQREFATVRR